DTAGQERYRSLTTAFFRDAIGFILMFDLTNENSFVSVRNWIIQLNTHAYCAHPDIILVGNKLDLTGERTVPFELAKKLAEEYDLKYIETSTLTGVGINQCIDILLELVFQRMDKVVNRAILPIRKRGETVKCNKKSSSNFCC
ncbi:hypothetical protein GJ496_008063, partial [Pomphorhynchus laevis]